MNMPKYKSRTETISLYDVKMTMETEIKVLVTCVRLFVTP